MNTQVTYTDYSSLTTSPLGLTGPQGATGPVGLPGVSMPLNSNWGSWGGNSTNWIQGNSTTITNSIIAITPEDAIDVLLNAGDKLTIEQLNTLREFVLSKEVNIDLNDI